MLRHANEFKAPHPAEAPLLASTLTVSAAAPPSGHRPFHSHAQLRRARWRFEPLFFFPGANRRVSRLPLQYASIAYVWLEDSLLFFRPNNEHLPKVSAVLFRLS